MPDWIMVLAEACDAASQTMVAKRIGFSSSVVSAMLRRTYTGAARNVEQAVRGALMREITVCPVAGEIPKHICLQHQQRAQKFEPTSSLRVLFYRNCRGGCPHSRMATTGGGDDQS
jgi:hypothetical protein